MVWRCSLIHILYQLYQSLWETKKDMVRLCYGWHECLQPRWHWSTKQNYLVIRFYTYKPPAAYPSYWDTHSRCTIKSGSSQVRLIKNAVVLKHNTKGANIISNFMRGIFITWFTVIQTTWSVDIILTHFINWMYKAHFTQGRVERRPTILEADLTSVLHHKWPWQM